MRHASFASAVAYSTSATSLPCSFCTKGALLLLTTRGAPCEKRLANGIGLPPGQQHSSSFGGLAPLLPAASVRLRTLAMRHTVVMRLSADPADLTGSTAPADSLSLSRSASPAAHALHDAGDGYIRAAKADVMDAMRPGLVEMSAPCRDRGCVTAAGLCLITTQSH